RKLRSTKPQSLASDLRLNTINLEHDAARFNATRPIVNRSFTLTHTNFRGLASDRNIRENTDPDPSLTLHLTGDCTTCRFNLSRRNAFRLERFEAKRTEVKVRAALGDAADASLELLTEFRALWLQHFLLPQNPGSGVLATALTTMTTSAITLKGATLGGIRVMLKDLALAYPNLDAADTIGGLCLCRAVINVGAQRVKRNAAFAVPFGTSDFRTAKTTGAVDTNAFGSKPHRGLNCTLHGATESNAAPKLLSDRLRDETSIDFRLAHFNDVQVHFALGHLTDLATQLLDVRALLADDQARTGSVDRHAAVLVRTLDHDLGDRSLLQLTLDILADLQILVQELAVLALVGVPTRVPGPVDTETQT